MPHSRKRLILSILKKQLAFFPVVSIQGARQTGKSFLARELLGPILPKHHYITLDDETYRSQIQNSAKLFLSENDEYKPLVIDEAQKVSKLFDAIKLKVDQKKIPGKYLILGSTDFSKEMNIREALTGRMGRVRVYPFTLQECIGLDSKSKQKLSNLLEYLEKGGLPGICFIREPNHRRALFQDWINLTCFRDLQQFKKIKLDGELALKILRQCSILEEPTKPNIAKALKEDARKIETHLKALVQLFALSRLDPHPSGVGKTIYLPFDCGLAHYLGASRDRCLHIWLLNEKLVENTTKHHSEHFFYFYKSTGKKMIHLVEEDLKQRVSAIQIIVHDSIKKTDSELMKAFLKKNKTATGTVIAPIEESLKLNEIRYFPWV
jgi:predicted AAA+ superfamily ATPase